MLETAGPLVLSASFYIAVESVLRDVLVAVFFSQHAAIIIVLILLFLSLSLFIAINFNASVTRYVAAVSA